MMMNFELCKIFKINKQKKEVKQRRKIYVKKMIIEEFLIFTETHACAKIFISKTVYSVIKLYHTSGYSQNLMRSASA